LGGGVKIVRTFGYGDPAGGRDATAARFGSKDFGGTLHSAADASWPVHASYGHRDGTGSRIARSARAVGRLILPVFTLLLAFACVYLYLDTPAWFAGADASWLTMGHLLVPLCFLTVHLTNRRYGPSTAFAQVVVSLAAAAAFVMFAVPQLGAVMPFKIVPEMRQALAFAGAFLGASFLSIVVFDGARGPRWWTAPLFGMVSAAVLFALIFYPAAYAGQLAWSSRMVLHMEMLCGLAVVSLIPYWSLRPLIRPLPGFGGY